MSNNNSNQERPENIWEGIKTVVAESKQDATNRYPDVDISKYDYIGYTVGSFIILLIENICPTSELYQKWELEDDSKITMNMILDSLGALGIKIGAAAFRLAEQLEIELPENDIEINQLQAVGVVNGEVDESIPNENISISSLYFNYFVQDEKAILVESMYLNQLLEERYSETDNAKYLSIIDDLMMIIVCDNLAFIPVYACLKNLIDNKPIVDIVKQMQSSAKAVEE